jgi:hypothetical protein
VSGAPLVAMARKVQRAASRGTGCRLTRDEVFELDRLEEGGEWWESLRPSPAPTAGEEERG